MPENIQPRDRRGLHRQRNRRLPGGWAAILTAPDGSETVLTGGEYPSTNNRMELMGALEGLAAAPEGSSVQLVTDSSYLANAISKGWLAGWQRKGWRTASSSRSPTAISGSG